MTATVRFLHTSDWQLGRAFSGFGDRGAEDLRRARFDTARRLAGVAEEHGVAFVVVAGDVFEHASPEPHTALEFLRLVEAFPCPVYVLPGNHDPMSDDGPWAPGRLEALASRPPPDNLHVLSSTEPVVTDGPAPAVLLPAPLFERLPTRDPTAQLADPAFYADLPDGAPRIVVAHGTVEDFGQGVTVGRMIRLDRLPADAVDYVALGDWHGVKDVSCGALAAHYSGAHEPDGFPPGDLTARQGHALVVAVARGAPPEVRPVRTGKYTWVRDRRTLRGPDDLDDLERTVDAWEADPTERHRVVDLELSGHLPEAAFERLEALAKKVRDRHLGPGLDLEEVVRLPSPEVWADLERSATPVASAILEALDDPAAFDRILDGAVERYRDLVRIVDGDGEAPAGDGDGPVALPKERIRDLVRGRLLAHLVREERTG